jgi:hypothetical protein
MRVSFPRDVSAIKLGKVLGSTGKLPRWQHDGGMGVAEELRNELQIGQGAWGVDEIQLWSAAMKLQAGCVASTSNESAGSGLPRHVEHPPAMGSHARRSRGAWPHRQASGSVTYRSRNRTSQLLDRDRGRRPCSMMTTEFPLDSGDGRDLGHGTQRELARSVQASNRRKQLSPTRASHPWNNWVAISVW